MKLKMGYLNAYEALERYIETLRTDHEIEKDHLRKILNDFGYCVQQTQICEKYQEIFEVLNTAKEMRVEAATHEKFREL